MNDEQGIALQKSKLLPFCIGIWPKFVAARHHIEIAKKLEAVESGKLKRLMIFMPPRHGKSMLASQFFPAWYLGRNPEKNVIFTSYSQEVAFDFGRKVKQTVRDPIFQQVFPKVVMDHASSSSTRFNLVNGGVFYAVGAGGALTSRGGHLIIIDDIIKGKEAANSVLVKNKIADWYRTVLYTRQMPGAAIVLIMTRWDQDDLAGQLLAQGEKWDVLKLPAIDEHDRALWPETFPIEKLYEIKTAIGSRDFESLYQQNPTPPDGQLVKRAWFKFYNPFDKPQFDTVIQSWDLSFKGEDKSDYTVGQVWGRKGANKYLLDQIRDKMDFTQSIQAIKRLSSKWPQAFTKVIEEKANGAALIATLRNEVPGLIPFNPRTSKVSRLEAISPDFESGNIYFPEPITYPWVGDLVEEIMQCPHGKHDDMVDAMTQALHRLRIDSSGTFSDAMTASDRPMTGDILSDNAW